ncbi:MAG: hypothetical protein ACYTF1_17745 [Planctomycetota bacterium]
MDDECEPKCDGVCCDDGQCCRDDECQDKCGDECCKTNCLCDDDDPNNEVCCKVDKIQYNDPDSGYTDVPDPLYVHKGTTVTFKALPHSCKDPFPSGKPVWGGSATGAGATTSVTFNTLSSSTSDKKTVTAKCGNTAKANVIVYQLTGVHGAQDYFTGRSSIKYGVAEIADLSFTVSPTGVTASQMGGLLWEKVSANGTISNTGTGGIGTYTCHYTTEDDVTLKLVIQSGPSKNENVQIEFDVTRPTNNVFELVPGSVWQHPPYPITSAGFEAYIYLRPTDVSFYKIGFGEGSCWATLNGWFAQKYPSGLQHQANDFGGVGYGNFTKGSQVLVYDDIHSINTTPPSFTSGWLTWVIPQRYNVGGGSWSQFTTATHRVDMAANGATTIQKKGVGPY